MKIWLSTRPPYYHLQNASEHSIIICKDHFVPGFASLYPNVPILLWYHLINQVRLILNLIRSSHINTYLSVEAQLNDTFEFNNNPCIPPVPRSLSIKPGKKERLGQFIESAYVTLKDPLAGIDDTSYIKPLSAPNASPKRLSFSHTTVKWHSYLPPTPPSKTQSASDGSSTNWTQLRLFPPP